MPVATPRSNTKKRTEASASLLSRWDREAIWHPFTQMSQWVEEDPLIIESAKGSYLQDIHGNRYLDGVSSLWCNVHGHRVRDLDRAVRDQLAKVAHSTFLGLSNVPAIELAQKLIRVVPKGLTRVFYSDSGSASVEVALKMAYQYWQQKGQRNRTKFVKLANAYHGDTLGSVSVGGISLFHQIYEPLLFKTIEAKVDLEAIEKIFKAHQGKVCAFIMEPMIQGAAGMLTQPAGFLAKVRSLTQKYDTLLILDEVATGFGRTGKMFACEHEAVRPDLLCVAKGLTAGYLPLAATIATEEIYSAFLGRPEEFKTFFHGHTYTANPLACAVASANLDLFEKNKTLEKLAPKIALLTRELAKFKSLRHVGEIRQVGFMAGIDLVRDKSTGEAYEYGEQMGARVIREARKHGLIIRPLGNVVVLMPPLSMSTAELKRMLRIIHLSIRKVTE